MRVWSFGWGVVLLFVLTLVAPAVYAGEGMLPLYKGFWQPRNKDALKCPSSKHLGRLSLFCNRGSGSSLFDVKPLFVDGSSGGSGLSVF